MAVDPRGVIILNKIQAKVEFEQKKYLLGAEPNDEDRMPDCRVKIVMKDILDPDEVDLFGRSLVRNRGRLYYETLCHITVGNTRGKDKREIFFELCTPCSKVIGLTGTKFDTLLDEHRAFLFPVNAVPKPKVPYYIF
jgi:hypothetical protein